MDREQLRKTTGLDYLLAFLKKTRGKQQVDMLGEALRRYFQSADVTRRDHECLNDFEQRLSLYLREIKRALAELGTESQVPSEIYGWFLLHQHIRLEPSDVATIKSAAGSYKLDSVQETLRRMWGGQPGAT